MERPQVRIVQDQQIEDKQPEISNYEQEMLLAKYGYSKNTNTQPQIPENNLTFEEMVKLQEQQKYSKPTGPKPITFDGTHYNSTTKYDTDSDLGFNYRIDISTDMDLPK